MCATRSRTGTSVRGRQGGRDPRARRSDGGTTDVRVQGSRHEFPPETGDGQNRGRRDTQRRTLRRTGHNVPTYHTPTSTHPKPPTPGTFESPHVAFKASEKGDLSPWLTRVERTLKGAKPGLSGCRDLQDPVGGEREDPGRPEQGLSSFPAGRPQGSVPETTLRRWGRHRSP